MGKQNQETFDRKRVYFRIFSWLLFCLIFALIEISLRLFSYGTDMHLFVKHKVETGEQYLKVNPHVGEKYFTRLEATTGTNDMFLRRKPENGFRVFLLGSSTLYGYPYDFNLMSSRILHKRLQDAFPERTIEVVNTSITAINSTTLRDYIRQVLQYDPDAILIYAGHNEYYGAFGPGSNETMSRTPALLHLHFRLINLRTYQLMRSAIGGISNRLAKGTGGASDRGTLMKRIVQDENIVYGGEQYQMGMEQFRSNLSYILRKSANHEVPLFLSDLVSNVRDLPPFGDDENAGLNARNTYREAIQVLARGDTSAARDLFYLAKDLDPIRFRASEEINGIVHELAEEYKATLIPAREWFSKASEGGLIGNNLLTEHVHPNIEGQFILADAFYTSIVESGIAGDVPDPRHSRSKAYYRAHWPHTALDSLIGAYKVEHLKSYWPFTSLETTITFRDTFQASGWMDSLAFSILTNPEASFESLHMQMAGHYEQLGEIVLATREYEALTAIDPYRSKYYTLAASGKLKMNDLFAAENYLRASMKFSNDPFAYSLLGEIETIKHNPAIAAGLYHSALEFSEGGQMPDKDRKALIAELQRKLSVLERNAGTNPPPVYSEYPKYVPKDIEPLYNKALSFSVSDSDSALYYFLQCLEINDCPLVNFRIGNMLYQQQDLAVLSYYDKAFDGFARDPDFLIRYCVAAKLNQELSKAKEIFSLLSAIAPRHPDLPRLMEALQQ